MVDSQRRFCFTVLIVFICIISSHRDNTSEGVWNNRGCVLHCVMGRFQELESLAQGTHGAVVKALDTKTGRHVAIKRPHYYEREVPVVVIREIKLLKEICHENVVHLVDVFVSNSQVAIVYELAARGALSQLLSDGTKHFSPAEVKGMVQMLLSGTAALHAAFVMHRDIKPDNVLVTQDGVLQLADFGLAKPFGDSECSLDTPEVVTYPYRAPELFFGAFCYSPVVDCWSVGCCAVEIWNRAPLFSSASELDALKSVAGLLDLAWAGAEHLPKFLRFRSPPADADPSAALHRVLPAAPPAFVALCVGLLTPDPRQRLPAKLALEQQYFNEEPQMAKLSFS